MNNAYPIARSQNIRRDEISINSQLMNAKEMEIWNFRQSIILQYPKSLSYKTVIPAAAEAAASESVAVTRRLYSWRNQLQLPWKQWKPPQTKAVRSEGTAQ
eukprot:TRINITY_DN2555_c0_g1_i1.p2 TRINITY_DN2555_c0_g1~~TRINITY_DN2555_c0_g1_i1.p2  ORF type:complete len:101 (+),score=18.97 TRINITY_DN2555_c0_g1_i1:489-791(+)